MADHDLRDDVMWVYQALGATKDSPSGPPPSPGAKGMLDAYSATPQLTAEFYRTVWIKFVPVANTLAAMERFKDDGRSQIDLLKEFVRFLDGPTGDARERDEPEEEKEVYPLAGLEDYKG